MPLSAAGNPACHRKPLMKITLDFPSFLGAIRTAGALMLGNAFVAPLILNYTNWPRILALASIGCAAIIVTSIKRERT